MPGEAQTNSEFLPEVLVSESGVFYQPLVQALHFIRALNGFVFMGCEGEMRPAAETIEPDKCITSHYLSTSWQRIKHLDTQSEGPEGPQYPPPTHLPDSSGAQREKSNGVKDSGVTRAFL